MKSPLKFDELKESDLSSVFKLKKDTKSKIFIEYKELNTKILKLGYYPITFPDFIQHLLEIGLNEFNAEKFILKKYE